MVSEFTVFCLVSTSLFILGIAIGGIIEYRRTEKRLLTHFSTEKTKQDEIARTIKNIDTKLRLINRKCNQSTVAIHNLKKQLEPYDPEKTQIIPKVTPRVVETPPLPYRITDLYKD